VDYRTSESGGTIADQGASRWAMRNDGLEGRGFGYDARLGGDMALDELKVGATASLSVVCAPEHFASRIVAGTPDVFSTPSLGALVEKTAAEWVAGVLAAGQMTVGTQIVVNHTGATPEGMTVTATVTLTAIDGRRIDFAWTAADGAEEVGNGTHQRFVVDRERFEQRLAAKGGG
jgi:predicted thioesterase